MKSFLGASASVEKADTAQNRTATDKFGRTQSIHSSQSQKASQAAEDLNDEIGEEDNSGTKAEIDAPIDWSKVGKVYDKNTDINEVVSREIGRINKAFEVKLEQHDNEIIERTAAKSKK